MKFLALGLLLFNLVLSNIFTLNTEFIFLLDYRENTPLFGRNNIYKEDKNHPSSSSVINVKTKMYLFLVFFYVCLHCYFVCFNTMHTRVHTHEHMLLFYVLLLKFNTIP